MEVKRYWVDGDLHPITSKDKQPHDVVLATDFDRILAERDALQWSLDSAGMTIHRLRETLAVTSQAILRHQAECPMSNRLERNLTKARTSIKKELEKKS